MSKISEASFKKNLRRCAVYAYNALRMRRLVLSFALALPLFAASASAFAEDSPPKEYQIHLITMGPGDHLYTRGGHAALMVAELENKQPKRTTIYNYGDTDWDNPYLIPQFLRGNLVFFLTENDSLMATVNEYGVRQARDVYRQRLFLSKEQAAEMARRLHEGSAVGKREYIFHHVHALCSTRINDILDDVLGGKLRAELASKPGPHTARYYQDVIFSRHVITAIAGDLLLGRLHDERVLNQYESMASPELMRAYFQTIMVPNPDGGEPALVPLTEPPVALVERKEPLVLERSYMTHYVWGFCIALVLFYGGSVLRTLRNPKTKALGVRETAGFVFPVALITGILGCLMGAFMLGSVVPEFRWNELILLFWPTDIWLAVRARRASKQNKPMGSAALRYMHVHLGVALLAVLGHAAGLLIQRPLILFALGEVMVFMLWLLIYSAREPVKAAGAAVKEQRDEQARLAA